MTALSQWLQLMLAEITRKQEDIDSARAEEERRASEQTPPPARAAPQPHGKRR